jgi:uncharacterized membrane protein YdjX (TVP38/TMEM64 family)
MDADRTTHRPVPFPGPPRWRRWATSRGLWTIVAVVAAGAGLVHGIEALGGAAGVRARFGPSAGLVLVPAQIVVSVSPVPGEIVAAVQVAIHGFWLGAALAWLGWLGAAFLEYGLVRWTAVEVAGSASRDRLPGFLRRLPADHPAFLIVARWLPFGSHVVNVTAGLARVPLGRLAWTAALSLVPTSLVFSAIAAGLLGP